MKVLVLNSGSSSIKYQLFDMNTLNVCASGMIEQIGESTGHLKHTTIHASGQEETREQREQVSDHRQGFEMMAGILAETGAIKNTAELSGIGHRVVHGGEEFRKPALITQDVIKIIRSLIPLAPLHNPANLTGIEVALEFAPEVPQVAVFDTAFHQSMPEYAFLYALPRSMYEKHRIRRYGFHGTSHHYVAKEAAAFLEKPFDSINLITLHLGNGASVAAIKNGKCIDTSMGMTPLEGLIMGTRSGDIDPAIIFYLARETGMNFDELDSLLNKESGLKGLCGVNDMREIARRAEKDDNQSLLAIAMFCYRLKKYIGSYMAILGEVDAIVFTGGIGENSPLVRSQTCEGMSGLAVAIDKEKNRSGSGAVRQIQNETAQVKVLVVATNEELEIARQTKGVLSSVC